jgi:hypothetical protein
MCNLLDCAYQGASAGQAISGGVKAFGAKFQFGTGTITRLSSDGCQIDGVYDFNFLGQHGKGTVSAHIDQTKGDQYGFALAVRGDWRLDYSGTLACSEGGGACTFKGQFRILEEPYEVTAVVTSVSGGAGAPSYIYVQVTLTPLDPRPRAAADVIPPIPLVYVEHDPSSKGARP